MGREARCRIELAGQAGEGTILLEATEIILRGAVKGRFDRPAATDARIDGEDLVLQVPDGPIRARMGSGEAARWLAALARPVPGLGDKLGVMPGVAVWRSGAPDDDALQATLGVALQGHLAASAAQAALVVAVLETEGDLQALLQALPDLAACPVWCVTVKGKAALLSEARVRDAMRGAGWIDSKACAVSPRHSATRYGLRR